MSHAYENAKGDSAEIRGLTVTVEFGEKTKAEIMGKVEQVLECSRELRKRYEDLEDKHERLISAVTGGLLSKGRTPNEVVEQVMEERWQDQTRDLRELALEMYPYVGDTCPDECRYIAECESENNRGTDGYALTCVAYGYIGARLRELGIEHDG